MPKRISKLFRLPLIAHNPKMAQSTMKALILTQTPPVEGKGVFHDATIESIPVPELGPGQVLVKASALAFNHRDLWMRKGLYPRIQYGKIMGSDAVGTVVKASNAGEGLLHKRVFVIPIQDWDDGPVPSTPHGGPNLLGCGVTVPSGLFSEYFAIDSHNLIAVPDYLSDEEAAAWPVAGLTAWRAITVNAQVQAGDNVLVTGIGGGVAILALQLCVALGANVYVTSSSEEKIQQAIKLGAKGGVNYKAADWPAQLAAKLKQTSRHELDSVIDGAGNEVLGSVMKFLRANGKVVCYGMHAGPKITMTMREVLKNHQIIGSTLGTRRDFIDSVEFIKEKKIVPVVSHVLNGLDSAQQGFDLLQNGDHFGKIVIKVQDQGKGGLQPHF